jgi:sporulation integral membrane protein YtvI
MDNALEKLNRLALFFVLYSMVFIAFFKTLPYTLPFVLAIIIALLLKRPTIFLIKNLKLNNTLAALLTTIIFFTVIITLLLFSIAALSSEIFQLTKHISNYFTSMEQNPYELFDQLKKYYNNLDPYIISNIERSFGGTISKVASTTLTLGTKIVGILVSFVSSVPYIAMVIIFTLIATYFFTKNISEGKKNILENIVPLNLSRINYIISESKKMLGSYIVSYMIIILITFGITLIGFLILRVNYAFLLSLLCAILDFLPVLGMPIVYIPLAIIYFIGKNYFTGVGLLILYALVFIVRQIVEPRIVSSSLGLNPVAVLAAIFIGLQANGVSGMFFCMFLVVSYSILKKVKVL